MQQITAVFKPHRLDPVIGALHALPRFPGFTVLDGHGQGHGRGTGGHYVYGEDGLLLHAQRVLIVICYNDEVDDIVQTIANAAHTGNPGDGVITVTPLQRTLRIRDAGGHS